MSDTFVRPADGQAAADNSHGAEWGAPKSAPLNTMGANVIQKNWQELIKPNKLQVSAGFDAHWRDPMADLNLTEADFGWATLRLMDVAERVCGGRIVSVLEGGYDLVGLSRSVATHVAAGEWPTPAMRAATSLGNLGCR